MKKFIEEFKTFALRGNVVDLAVGVIIGGAFQTIVKSLTNDLLMPFIGLFVRTDFQELVFKVRDVEIRYGAFVSAVINFFIMAFIIFLMVKAINTLTNLGKKKEEIVEEITTKTCPYCQSEIAIAATRCPHCTSELEN
ncbi:MAG: large conductance mechanosensitive channel protein MscL [Clostridia bacterium]|nr:large conductance mechanosensitive channel protein MscL [Clostridia bacterium]